MNGEATYLAGMVGSLLFVALLALARVAATLVALIFLAEVALYFLHRVARHGEGPRSAAGGLWTTGH